MPKSRNQKLKIVYIYDIFKQYTDVSHGVTVPEIIERLSRLGIEAERKSVYEDIYLLRDVYGADIETVRNGRRCEYRLLSREFELPELKLLVDAAQSSRFITQKKTDELIGKLEALASVYGARELQGQVYVTGRIKTMNETVYYNVDAVNEAIVKNRMICFHYFEWLSGGKKRLRRNGDTYKVSPLALSWDSENYYLIAFDATEEKIKHYRVDKMLDIACTDTPRAVTDGGEGFDTAVYSRSLFGMFSGESKVVTMRCENSLAGAVIDRFGADTMTVPDGESFTFTVKVQVSSQFFAWVCGLGDGIEITAPIEIRRKFEEYVVKILGKYTESK